MSLDHSVPSYSYTQIAPFEVQYALLDTNAPNWPRPNSTTSFEMNEINNPPIVFPQQKSQIQSATSLNNGSSVSIHLIFH